LIYSFLLIYFINDLKKSIAKPFLSLDDKIGFLIGHFIFTVLSFQAIVVSD